MRIDHWKSLVYLFWCIFMNRFTIKTLFILITWCAVFIVTISQYYVVYPHDFKIYDIADVVFSSHGLDGVTESKVSQEDADGSPTWNVTNANPPISACRALAIANSVRKERLIDTGRLQWNLVSLALYPIDGENNKWCWCVTFQALPKRGPLFGPSIEFRVFVLMNGKVVPLVTKEYDGLKEMGILTDSGTSD